MSPVVILGLGRFGMALAEELVLYGVEVMAVDTEERRVNAASRTLAHCVVADSVDIEVLRKLGVDEVQRAVVAIGSNLEASILSASNLVELGVPNIWAKADSDAHARILEQIGAHHVVRPERDTARRVAHLLDGSFQDYAEFDEHHGVIKMVPPRSVSRHHNPNDFLYNEYGVYVTSCRIPGKGWLPAAKCDISAADLALFAGDPAKLEAFAKAAGN
ncbi:hypothetical protein CPHO_03030 [Corynebacterium phocae]|uniref:RCK N-terminal domain-containing protein n=2 Tax=Corynebacterium phocae TaxID=161895 RepID=A0A1L7D635_9CORY|nr:hypothetical protein CPHO_03030 [Corynebacterium phocae]KAA8726536.1 TrkA family potassium uptake protein [Corynebacterium phocae]